jgi:membrane dipeptidase
MLVDVSHASDETFFDVVAVSGAPVIASHSSARALNDHPRNLTDAQLRAIARTGGVVNVNFYPRFIDPAYLRAALVAERPLAAEREALIAAGREPAAADTEIEARLTELTPRLPATPLSVLIDHFDHVATVAGVDHVGLGSDFDGISAVPEGLDDVTGLPVVAQALLDRGYSAVDVTKVLGGNMMRVIEQVLDRGVAAE